MGTTITFADPTLVDAFVFKGVINASTNPNYPAANAGDTYKISVAGKVGGASGAVVEVGDTIYATVDGSAAGTQAAVGANWAIVQGNLDVSVDGTMAANSDALIPSQKATRTYVTAAIAAIPPPASGGFDSFLLMGG